MSEHKDNPDQYPIPGRRRIDSFAHVQASFQLKSIPNCAGVSVEDDLGIRLYLGELAVTMQPDVWRPIIAALNAALAQADGTRQQVGIPDNLDALISAIEDAEAMDVSA